MDERAVNDVAANAMNRPSVYVPALVDEITRLRAELYSCKEELREIAVAADDARVHNTMTLAEYVAALRAELAECRDALAKIGPYYVPSTELSDDEVNAMYAMIDAARKGEGE